LALVGAGVHVLIAGGIGLVVYLGALLAVRAIDVSELRALLRPT
jgi:hypothetical protein